MSKVVIRTGLSNTSSVLRAARSRANDNVGKVAGAEPEICGAFVPITFEEGIFVPAPRATRIPTVVRRMRSRGALRAANFNGPRTFERALSARILNLAARLLRAFRRARDITRAVSKLQSMSDVQLSDIGVERCDIDFIVRHGRPSYTGQ